MTPADLIGTWTLVSHGFQAADGTYRASGDNVRGQLIYASDGAMSVLIMKKAPDAENLQDLVAYAGRFSVEGDVILHHIDYSPTAARERTTERRIALLAGKQLTLTTPPKANGHFIITWQRR